MAFGFDPSIVFAGMRQDGPTPNDTLQTLANLATHRAQQQHAQVQLADLVRKQQQEQTLADVYRTHAGDVQGLPSALMRGGFGREALGWMEEQAQAQSRQASARRALQDAIRDRMEFIGRPLRGVRDQAGLDAAFEAYRQAGIPDDQLPTIPRVYDKSTAPVLERLAAMGLSTDQVERLAQRDEEIEARRKDRELWRDTVVAQKTTAAAAKKEETEKDDTTNLRKEISGRKEIAKYREASAELQSLRELAKDDSGASNMAIIFAFLKSIDPESVVRETEYATAAATGTLDERMQGLLKKYYTGGPLTSTLRQKFVKAAEAAQSGHKAAYERAVKTYKYISDKRKIDPKELGLEEPGAGGAKRVRSYRYNKDRTKRVPIFSDGTQGEAEAVNGR
jgi:hypothetical protein